jgi:hypothetical protein
MASHATDAVGHAGQFQQGGQGWVVLSTAPAAYFAQVIFPAQAELSLK